MKKMCLKVGVSIIALGTIPVSVFGETGMSETIQDVTSESKVSASGEGGGEYDPLTSGESHVTSDITDNYTKSSVMANEGVFYSGSSENLEPNSSSEQQAESSDSAVNQFDSNDSYMQKTELSDSNEESKKINRALGVEETVEDVDSLAAALQSGNTTTIYLGKDIDLGDARLPVNHSVVIDGNGHTLTYGNSSGGGMGLKNGIYYDSNGITIHYRNIKFGKQESLGKKLTTNANNWYGIAPAEYAKTGLTLIIENVGYYSDYGAQPIHIEHEGNQVIFKGNNEFIMQGTSGTYSQEFAQATNFTFDEGSYTKIVDENMDNRGFIWSYYESLYFKVSKNATVDISTRHNFIYADRTQSKNPSISIEDGGTLKINQSDTTASDSTGKLAYHDDTKLTIDVGKNSNLDIRTKNSSKFSQLTVNLGENSTSKFSSGNGSVIDGSKSVFNVDNINKLTFNSETTVSNQTGAIGSTNGTISFSQLSGETKGYNTFVNEEDTALDTQMNEDSWGLSSKGFTRSPRDFTEEQKNQLASAKNITIERIVDAKDNPTTLSWEATGVQKIFEITKYDYEVNDGLTDKFYWRDIDNGDNIHFELWDNQGNKLALISQVTSTGEDTFQLQEFVIDKSLLKKGENNFVIKSFKVDASGNASGDATDELTLKVTILEGALTLEKVPDTLKWTNRLISESKGILARDTDNDMYFEVSDSRVNKTSWEITASVEGATDASEFDLVWKANADSNIVDLDGAKVLTSETEQNASGIYDFPHNEGVLLRSKDYLKIGEYRQLTIVWTLKIAGDIE